jgi:hypothetical protein
MKKLIYLGLALSAGLYFTSCVPDKETPPAPPPGTGGTTFTPSSLFDDADTVNFITINDNGAGIGNYTMKKDVVYLLEGFVFVNEGQTLTIEPGTIIKGKSGQGENASALVVAKGGKIMAEGTAANPIIMTAEADGLNRNDEGALYGKDELGTASGLWGGLIVLGKAGLNSNPGTTAVEGIPTTESRGIYGGTNDADNSGVLKYISIRHGGTNIGANNEINGLTLGGVGSGTTIDFIEVFANADDGVEFFGGTANVKHILINKAGDDSFDYDEGYRGKGQFWVSISPTDRAGEHDGGTDPETATPYATPTIYNATYIGGKSVTFRDNAGGYYYNSIFEGLTNEPAMDVEDMADGEDSRKRFEGGVLKVENNVFANCKATLVAYSTAKTTAIDGGKNMSSTTLVSATNPIPTTAQTATAPTDSFYEAVTYKGAFGTTNWAAGWTISFPAL